tara:strand:- start:299 stop:499 length:201 start_codon:yes stop_codon:yes gene_type:complete
LLLLFTNWKENFLLIDEISQLGIAALIGTSIAAFFLFNKSSSNLKDGFKPESKKIKWKKLIASFRK